MHVRTDSAPACELAADVPSFVLAGPRDGFVSRRKVDDRAGESFSRRQRLTHAKEFQQVFNKNFRRADAWMTILVGRQPGERPRLGFAIARKQVPRAVRRNALKRLFRESFRRNRFRLPARDIVIMVRREIQNAAPPSLRAALDQHWNSIIEQCEKS